MNQRRLTAIILALALSLPLFAQSKGENTIVFTPQWTAQAQFAGYYAALELGFYKEEGLEVVIEHPNASRSAIDRMRKNQSQVTTLPLSQAIFALDSGVKLVNLLQTSMNGSLMIVSRRGVNPLKQKGARVASFRAGYDQLARAVANELGLEYEWLETASLLNLFIAGAVDASVAMSFNEYYQFLQTGLIERNEDIVYRLSDHGYNIQEEGLYMTREEYDKNPERARKFARASQRGWEWVAYHQEEALEIVMRQIHRNHEATNPTLQRLMLEEVLDLMEGYESGEREYVLRGEMVNQAVALMLKAGIIRTEHTIKELLP